jgi:hypothetical protein
MSFFDDDSNDNGHYYDPQDNFQRRVLHNAEKADMHPIAHLASQLQKGVDCMEEFTEQDPHISKRERIAIRCDTEEAREALTKACTVIPQEVNNGHNDG